MQESISEKLKRRVDEVYEQLRQDETLYGLSSTDLRSYAQRIVRKELQHEIS